MNQTIILVAAFAFGLLYDFVWAKCVDSVQHSQPIMAANLGAVLYICTLLSTYLIFEKCILAIVLYGIGNWIGVYFAVRGKKK